MQGDGRADEVEQLERRHREPERRHGAVRVLDPRAGVHGCHDLAEVAREQPVHDECGRICDEHAGLAERLPHVERGGQRSIVGALPAHDLQQRQHGDRVEEVEAHDPLWVRQVRRKLRHRQRRGVGREDAIGPYDGLEVREHLLLDLEILEHGLDHEVGVAEHRPAH